MDRNTSHFRHSFIFSRQFCWGSPRQIVPLINQQRFPLWNSHAGHFCLVSTGHFSISQHGLLCPLEAFFMARRNNIWRWTCTGMRLHPCSKLWMAFTEVPSSCANWLWVFPNRRRMVENSFLSTEAFLQVRYLYHDVAHVKGKGMNSRKSLTESLTLGGQTLSFL